MTTIEKTGPQKSEKQTKISGKHGKILENQIIILKKGIEMERIKHLAGLGQVSHTTEKSESYDEGSSSL